MKEIINDAQADQVEISTSQLSVSINKVEHAGLHVYLKFMGLSPELLHEFNNLKAMHKFTLDNKLLINFVFEIRDGTVDEVMKKLEEGLKGLPE